MSFSSLPVVDLESDPDSIRRSIFLACSTTGFFYLSNHSLSSSRARMFALAKEFFHLPLDEKMMHSLTTSSYQGYLRAGHENLDSTDAQLIDEKEAFKFRRLSLLTKDILPTVFSREDNYAFICDFFRACYDLCQRLLECLAESFEIDRDYFTSRHKWEVEPGDTLKLLHYPPTNKTEHNFKAIRAGAHSDYGSLTLLFQHENKAGLEVLNRSANTWHSVEARDDLIVVNFGDAFEYWSNGLIKSTVHRVCLPSTHQSDEDRFSIAYFCDPNGETPLTPIPSKLIKDRVYEKDQHAARAFDPRDNGKQALTAGEHLLMRLNKTHTN